MIDAPLSLEILPAQAAFKPGEAWSGHVLVRVRAPQPDPLRRRPRLTAVLALDVSYSMEGEPLAQVIHSTQRIADILSDDDALGVVAFDGGARTVSPVRQLDAAARREIKREVAALAAGP